MKKNIYLSPDAPTAAAPAPEASEAPEAPTVQEMPITVGQENFILLAGEKTKGKNKGELQYLLKQEEPVVEVVIRDQKAGAFNGKPYKIHLTHLRLAAALGIENYSRESAAMIRSWCNDATHDVAAKAKDGQFTDTDWIGCLQEQVLPGSRRATGGVKQFREKQKAILDEMNPLMMRKLKGEELTEEEDNRLLILLADYGEINEKIEKGSRKGKKKTATTPATPAPAAK